MSTIKAKVVDKETGKPLGYGVAAAIVKSSDKKNEQLGGGFVTDDNSLLTITSKLLDYTKDADAVDILISTNGYEPQRFSPDEFSVGDLKLRKKKNILLATADKAKEKARNIPLWAWEAGGIVLAAATIIVLIVKKNGK